MVNFWEAITKKIHYAILDWYVHDIVAKWKFPKYYPKYKVADHTKNQSKQPWYTQWMVSNLLKIKILYNFTNV